MIVSILCGRGGSKGMPGKNTGDLLGRPAMAYPLLACENAKSVEHMFVSTDDAEIASIAEAAGCEVIERPAELCTDGALLQDAIQHAYFEVGQRYEKPSYVVVTLCNAPNILAETIDQAVGILDSEPAYDSVITAGCFDMFSPERARTPDDKGLLKPYVPFDSFPHEVTCDRRSHDVTYFADQGVAVVRGECLEDLSKNLLPFQWMGQSIGYIEQISGGGDIDYPWQVAALEWWLREHGFDEERTPYDD